MKENYDYFFSNPGVYSFINKYRLLKKNSCREDLFEYLKKYLPSHIFHSAESDSESVRKKSQELDIRSLDYYHEYYPSLLKEIESPPAVLFYRGNPELLKMSFIAVVGTRKASPISLSASKMLPSLLKKSGNSGIVSGMAIGIDRAAMLSAIDADIPTIGILGTGLDKEYPPPNKDLYKKMKSLTNTLILTETRVGEQINAWNFPRRNRIITGISSLLILMEAPLKSGAMTSVTHAISQDKEILVFDHPELSYNEGGRKLISEGAKKLILEDLISPDKKIFHISEIVPEEFKDAPLFLARLSKMEREGFIEELGGGYFKAVA